MRLRIVFSSLMVAVAVAMTGCGLTGGANLPPASRLMEPGPGVGGPGPGVLASPTPGVAPANFMTAGYGAGVTAGYGGGYAAGCLPGDGAMVGQENIQVLFAKPDAMQVAFDAGGGGAFNSVPMITPARQNFYGGGIYRLKLTGIPGREGTELYPTLEIAPASNRSRAYLAHNAVPVQFTEEDFDQVLSGNFVTKVIYLPDPDFQELALAGVETLVSTRLDPGLDPIEEARRRGAILGVVRIGNKDIEIPGGESPMMGVYGAKRQPAGSGVMPAQFASMPAGAVAPMPAGTVAPASFGAACNACGGGPCTGSCRAGPEAFYGPNSTPRGGFGPGGLPPGLAGGGQYGMPITGTPIGLPGPPHVPLGVPAGLKKHVMHNWTKRHIPDPVKKLKINVKQRPGLSYPQPASRAWVVEDTIHSTPHYSNKHFGGAPAVGGPVGVGGSTQAGSRGLIHEMKGLFGKHH